MKRLIRSRATRQYLGRDGHWTSDVAQAAEFPDTETVISLQIRENLRGIEEVLQMGKQPSQLYDVAVPLPDL